MDNMRNTIAITLAALGFVAAHRVEVSAADRWQADMAKFAAQDREHPPQEGGVVFVGSSSIRLWDLEKSFPNLNAVNRGFGGSEVADSVKHVDLLVLRHKPRVVVLYAGDNDIAHEKTPEQVARDFDAFVSAVRKELPETKILYIAIKPSVARWKLADQIRDANSRIQAACEKDEHCEFVDVWPPMLGDDGKPKPELFNDDGLHMNDAGYAIWAKRLEPHLN
jgi:lysophospholipase L1-like esterase